MDENVNACAPISGLELRYDRVAFAILDDADRVDAPSSHDEVVLLRREGETDHFVQIGVMQRYEALVIVGTAQRADRYADLLESHERSARALDDLRRRRFEPIRFELVGWFRPAKGRERGPKFTLTHRPPEDGHEWTQLGRAVRP